MTTTPMSTAEEWLSLLGPDVPVLELPADHDRSGAGGVHDALVDADAGVVAAHRRLADSEDTSPFVVRLAVTVVLLARVGRQRDLVLGAGRSRSHWHALRIGLDGEPTFREVVRRVRAAMEGAEAHGPLPHDLLTDVTATGVPLVRATFTDDAEDAAPRRTPDLALAVRDVGDGLAGRVRAAAALFDPAGAEHLAVILGHLLVELPRSPDEPVFAHSPLPPAERERVLRHLNPHRRPEITHTTMAQPFEEQVRRSPTAVALVSDEETLTYAELNERANRLAWFLRAHGARPGTRVAVALERGFGLLVALYAVAKSGAAYVPLDPELPDARMAFMLEDSAPVALLVDRSTRPRLPGGPALVLSVEDDGERWSDRPADDLPPAPGSHLLHHLYTSGTTGRPKAVSYPVEGALADTFWLHERYPYGPGDTVLLKTSYGFDVSIWEIFWPLYCGSRVAILPPGAHRDPSRLRDFIDRHEVTGMFMVPTMMQPFYDRTAPGDCPSLKRVYVGGEPVTPRVRDGFHERFDAELVNLCGPTELGCVAETVLRDEPGAPVMIGSPPPHRRVYLLDDFLGPTPIGVPGELFVGGEVGLAEGYHRRAGLTAERFLADPYGPAGARMYRTGDLCRYRHDGVLEHLGRVGRQVKVRGVRVELAEVEAVLLDHDDVGRAVVAVVPDRAEIAAFVVAAEGRALSVRSVLEHARSLLPTAMVPSTLTVVDSIPTFVHGKVDVESLLALIDRSGGADGAVPVAPEGSLEDRVERIFAELLGRDSVSVTESFFALGGHSLLVFKLIELCDAEFRTTLSVREVVSAPTVRGLSAAIARHGSPTQDGAVAPG